MCWILRKEQLMPEDVFSVPQLDIQEFIKYKVCGHDLADIAHDTQWTL